MAATSLPSGATIARCLEAGLYGFVIGNRLSLPFRAELISILIGKQHSMVGGPDFITDFSPSDRAVTVVEKENRMDIYFYDHPSLQQELGHWRGRLVITCCEEGTDLFDPSTHIRLALTFRDDDPRVKIEVEKQGK